MKNLTSLFILAICVSSLYAQNHLQEAWVRNYASGLAPSDEAATAIVVDPTTNHIFVAGYISTASNGQDYYTAEYDAAGKKIWSATYDGPAHGNDRASAIGIDVSGNVYVTGRSPGNDGSPDYVTIKYNSNGIEQWATRFANAEKTIDEANALAVDHTGNVYITGNTSLFDKTQAQYLTIKYRNNGNLIWVDRYDEPGIGPFEAYKIALDHSGNIYVSGRFATVKYNQNGVVQWARSIKSPASGLFQPKALAVDKNDNILLTGFMLNPFGRYVFTTVKYDASGIEKWLSFYEGPALKQDEAYALTLDDSNHVYVIGRSIGTGNNWDYATVKYNSDGVQQWAARHNGSDNGYDGATAITLDRSGNVYVTGESDGVSESKISRDIATVKYNRNGIQQWVARYNGSPHGIDQANALVSDAVGNVYVIGKTEGPFRAGIPALSTFDYVVIKYDGMGNEKWVARENGPASFEQSVAMALDSSGNIYVSGNSQGFGTLSDIATIKYNAAGAQQWSARYNGPTTVDEVRDLAVDASGNVYVVGNAIIKYNNAGVEQWKGAFQGLGDYFRAFALALDAAGNAYVLGSVFGNNYTDFVIIKYDSADIEQWVATYNGPGNYNDFPSDIITDGKGNVYAIGITQFFDRPSSSALSYYTLIKYDEKGERNWFVIYQGSQTLASASVKSVIDNAGNVYLTGTIFDVSSSADYMTIKYNNAGIEQWVARYNELGASGDLSASLAVDATQNVYVTGISDFTSQRNYTTIKYNKSGVQEWIARYQPSRRSFNDPSPTILALDKNDNIYITGIYSSDAFGRLSNFITLKYNNAGQLQWTSNYNTPGYFHDRVSGLALDRIGNVYLAGTTEGEGGSFYTTIKYDQNKVAVAEKELNTSNTFSLAQNYPNPFNPSTKIRYAIAKSSHVTLKVFNLRGQEIATLVNENKPAGEYDVMWHPTNLPSGVYLYRLQVGDFSETQKLVLLR